jgi:hypothetical protein
MATSGTTNFSLDIEEIIEKAYELIGRDIVSADDLNSARKSLNLLLIDMQNRGHPLASLQNNTFSTTSGTSQYSLSAGIVDVMSMVVVRSSTATPVERTSLFEYHKIPNKTSEGLPTQFAVDRDRDNVELYLYLTPENSTDTVDYWCLKQIEDAGAYTNTLDTTVRYQPAVVFGLAYFLTLGDKSEGAMSVRNELKMNYLDALGMAMTEDRERTSFRVTPFGYHRR